MAYDFRANQIRLNRIISSGSIPIYVYSSGSAADFQGGINFPTANIGSDVFLFVSGSSTAKTLFGGDVVISGSVSGSTGGFTYLSGSVAVLGSTDATGLTISLRGLRVTGSYMQGTSHTVTSPDGNNCFVAGQSNTVNAGSAFVHGYGNTSLANYSHAEGNGGNTINALAVGSHAEGQSNTIHGESAHAEGQGTTVGYSGVDVFGDYSHTEGNGTQTYGVHSHAEGYQTTAGATTAYFWGEASHAEGANTIALGRGSHAEGRGSIAYGACTHAGGLYTIASGSVSPIANFSSVDFTQTAYGKYNKRDNTTSLFVVGDGTGDSDALRHDILRVESGSVQITGSLIATGITGSISGTVGGYPYVAAGPNITTNYNSLGQWEISGSSGVASDYFFSRYANIIEASGSLYLSGALRTTTISASHGAFITGSFVQGVAGNEASGTNSHAEGYQTHAQGVAAHSEGNNTIASNSYAHSEGINTTASGLYSHAEGNSSDASDDGAHAEGYNTTASGQYSHSEGYNSIASARGSHGEGEQTFATGVCSHAEGSGSVAYGEYSHAGGENTNAIGNSSQTGGNSTIASGSYQTVFGQYNTRNNTSSLFVVGNGTGDGDAFRHDILCVNSSSVEVSGSLTASAVIAGGVNITPITASLVFGGDGVNRASGSISGLFESGSLMTLGTIGKFDVEILAMSYGSGTGASWKYTTTALWPYSGNFSFLAATELAAEYGPIAGSYNPAADWDVNFNNLGQIELTGSAAAFPSGGTSFYIQVTKKMVATYAGIIA